MHKAALHAHIRLPCHIQRTSDTMDLARVHSNLAQSEANVGRIKSRMPALVLGQPRRVQTLSHRAAHAAAGVPTRRLQTLGKTRRPLVSVASGQVIFFLDASEEGFKLPLEPQQFLGLKPGQLYRDSMVNQAYDDLAALPIEDGYSKHVTAGRVQMLDLVRIMTISNKTKPLDERPRETTVPFAQLPAALALLTELNENELVMYVGSEMLASRHLDAYQGIKGDVLLSMALAKCNLAREQFAASKQVAAGCKHLEEALQLLTQQGGAPVAPVLAREVRDSLTEMHAQYALEQVSSPLVKELSADRKRALTIIQGLLQPATSRAGGVAGSAGVDAEFVGRVMPQLTCEEAVQLLDWAALARNTHAHAWVYPGLIERAAAAHILLGFLRCEPSLIKEALALLKLQAPSSTVLVAQAVCKLLLGGVTEPLTLLQRAEMVSSKPSRPSTPGVANLPNNPMWGAQALSYVRDHTPAGSGDMLPGLCRFTEQWLAQAAGPLFRDTTAKPPNTNLATYFESRHVNDAILRYDEKQESQSPGVPGMLAQLQRYSGQAKELGKTSLDTASAVVAETVAQVPRLNTRVLNKLPLQVDRLWPAVVGVVALGVLFWPRAPAAPTHVLAAATAGKTAHRQAVVAAPGNTPLNLGMAEQVLRLWQDVKACALGPSYDTSDLSLVLVDPLLHDTIDKVAKFKSEGWYMKYKLHKIKVRDVEVEAGEGRATVYAVLNESATLYEVGGKQADSYKETYEAKYTVVKTKDGHWKVSHLHVLDNGKGM